MINKDLFVQYLQKNRGKKVNLFCDIETATCNKKTGRINPSKYHSFTYSLAISFFLSSQTLPDYFICSSFEDMFNIIFEYGNKKSQYHLNFHNGNKYDNHFLISEISRDFPHVKIYNSFIRNAVNNISTMTKSKLDEFDKKGAILEKRVKTSNNVEAEIFLNGFNFLTVDNFVKTNTSISVIGKKLKDKGYITDEYLKTDFNYSKFDLEDDLSIPVLKEYVKEIFKSLNDEDLIYIRNDVIILALCYKYYSDLFFGFDYNEYTFTSNIKKEYTVDNDFSSFQLLKKIGKSKLSYTNYHFHNLNFFDYLNRYYRGGLNFYNYKYLGKVLKNGISFDINSSYPYVMYHFKLPTFLQSYYDFKKPTKCAIEYDFNYITFFTIPINYSNELLNLIPSKIFRQILVKYYSSKNGEIYISSIIVNLLNEMFNLNIKELTITSYVTFNAEDFGAKNVLEHNYYIKTQGKQSKKINMITPENITLTDEKNDRVFSKEEIDGAKVLLNGIYGIPALRSHFNLFRRNENNEIYNIENGFENSERNVIFSACVTAYAFYNLLSPLKNLPTHLIDEYFWYCDTDSLYLDKKALQYMPKDMFHKMNLGKWDIENEHIEKFYILNHKKYAYVSNGKIKFRCGGVRKSNFNIDVSFEDFIKYQFSDGVKIPNTRSIRNEWNTISIYEGTTLLEHGKDYPDNYSKENEEFKKSIIESIHQSFINEAEQDTSSQLLYVETEYGTISTRDFIPERAQGDYDLYYFMKDSKLFKNLLNK